MLIAGSLGTVIGDGRGSLIRSGLDRRSAFNGDQHGRPRGHSGYLALALPASYWLAIVAVRWWGTNTGDILAFFSSLTMSMLLTGAAMVLVLFFWHQRPFERMT